MSLNSRSRQILSLVLSNENTRNTENVSCETASVDQRISHSSDLPNTSSTNDVANNTENIQNDCYVPTKCHSPSILVVDHIEQGNEDICNNQDTPQEYGSQDSDDNNNSPISPEEPYSPASTDHEYIPSSSSNDISATEIQEESPMTNNILQPRKRKIFQLKEKLSKKRSRNEAEWKQNRNSILRQEGKAYVTRKGKTMESKKPRFGILCKETCKYKCYEKFCDIDCASLFSQYYSLKNNNEKNMYLSKFITVEKVKRALTNPKRQRCTTYTYVLPKGSTNIKVCKTAFSNMFQIGYRKLAVIQSKIKLNNVEALRDQRGKTHSYRHKVDVDVENYISSHIRSFPSESSHYSRNQNIHKQYLNPLLTIKTMYSMYTKKCEDENKPTKYYIKECTYRKIFNTKFNLSFRQPRTDVCCKCDSNTQTEEHIENYKRAFELQKLEREMAVSGQNMTYISFDMQQTQPLPKIPVSKAFYLRQIWFYNEGIHIVDKNGHRSYFCTWTEDCGGKGSVEVLSSLFYCLSKLANVDSSQNLLLWSDSASGQNKNQYLIVLYQYMIAQKLFVSIEHKFPEVGHTFLDCDRDFGRIEKLLRKHEKIFTPNQYRNIIKRASKNNSIIEDMNHHFYDFTKLKNDLGIVIPNTNTLKQKINFKGNVKWIRHEDYGRYFYKTNYDPYTPYLEVSLVKNPNIIPEVALTCNNQKGKISKEKIADIKTQLEYIEKESQWYYINILNND
ncbi:uncharacterized protein LOC121738382 isoform X2 [Aricia agestis]|uniref:uncharacterized protein LOC121727604 isoform X2 n=1 Tax=Aricia agestis TaxID=91739 RepID=UPI001C203FD1|nr:uncharacterized protein LOC121727604 isoform X2 [Aricia agestis]XP_041980552.1 uncharacterized protein LOC121734168 isoform X2 [Aricia agestis]XP_041981894.1 uncharacterized protein LOC121735220 isoform X2 [Aricia agestis]XP_041986323.1 uncharacterized protein LOC121738382 isoform X2 [Aricia agestis]